MTTRKSAISAVAEAMAFFAGLSFWSKLFKYFITINHIGRYYDRRYKIFAIEEKKPLRNNDSLDNKNQFFAPLEGPKEAQEPPNTSGRSCLKLRDNRKLASIRSQDSGRHVDHGDRNGSAYNFSGVVDYQYGSNPDRSKGSGNMSGDPAPERIEMQL